MVETAEKIEEKKAEKISDTMKTVLMYALSVVTALGLNDLVTTIFDNFSNTQHVITKTTYVVIMFGATLATAYYLSQIGN